MLFLVLQVCWDIMLCRWVFPDVSAEYNAFLKSATCHLTIRCHIVWRPQTSVHIFLAINPLNAELNPICHLLALLGGATIVVVSRLRVNRHFSMV